MESPSPTPRLAIAYDITSSSPMELSSQLSAVCEIVWVVDLANPALGPMRRLIPRLGPVIDTHDRTLDEVIELVGAHGVDGVVAYCDDQLALAAAIASALGLAGNPPEVVERLNDKFVQRATLRAAGLPMPGFCRIPAGSTADEVVDLAAGLRFPAVLKPLHGDSSKGVVAVDDAASLRRAVDQGPAAGGSLTEDFIVEEYLADRVAPGTTGVAGYVSVEIATERGVPIPLAVTGKFTLAPPFRETGNFMPHPLEAAEAAAVISLATEAAAALGVRSGVLHVEIKLTPDGPRIIEVNGRVAGGAIDLIYAKRNGRSLTEVAALIALGHQLDLVAESPQRRSGPFDYEFFAQPPMTARRLVSVRGTDGIVGTAGAEAVAANRSPGDDLDWRRGSQEYVLRITGVAPDRDRIAAVPAALLAAASITYDDA